MSKRAVILASASSLVAFAVWSLVSVAGAGAQSDALYKDTALRIIAAAAPGGGIDTWSRLIARHLGRHLPGNPRIIVLNMPGAGGVVAANHLYRTVKPDGLSIGLITPALYFDQLLQRDGVLFDWGKYTWIGSPEWSDEIFYVRSDSPYKTAEDLRRTTKAPACGASGTTAPVYYFPRLLQLTLGFQLQMVVGYKGTADTLMALERGEVVCRAGTISTYFGTDPLRTWHKSGFLRVIVQGGVKRDARLPDVPTIYELLDKERVTERTRRLVDVVLAAGNIGRPVVAPPGVPADRVKVLREGFTRLINDPAFAADAKKLGWELNPVSGEDLERLAKQLVTTPTDVVEGLKEVLLRN